MIAFLCIIAIDGTQIPTGSEQLPPNGKSLPSRLKKGAFCLDIKFLLYGIHYFQTAPLTFKAI